MGLEMTGYSEVGISTTVPNTTAFSDLDDGVVTHRLYLQFDQQRRTVCDERRWFQPHIVDG